MSHVSKATEFVGVMVTYVDDLMVAASHRVAIALFTTITALGRTKCAGLMINHIHVTLPEEWKQCVVKLVQFLGVTIETSCGKFYMHQKDRIRAQILKRNCQNFTRSLSLRSPKEGKIMLEDRNEHFCKRHKEALVEIGTLLCIAKLTPLNVSKVNSQISCLHVTTTVEKLTLVDM